MLCFSRGVQCDKGVQTFIAFSDGIKGVANSKYLEGCMD
jgi:hypothetical protein